MRTSAYHPTLVTYARALVGHRLAGRVLEVIVLGEHIRRAYGDAFHASMMMVAKREWRRLGAR